MEPKACERWDEWEKCSRRGLALLGGEGYSWLRGVITPLLIDEGGPLETEDCLERRYGLVSTLLPVS
jgi:hypothetical protein